MRARSVLASVGIMCSTLRLGAADLPRPCRCPAPPPPSCASEASRIQPYLAAVEVALVVNFGDRRECHLPRRLPLLIPFGQTVDVQIRLVYATDILSPVRNRQVKISVIDTLGLTTDKATLSQTSVRTAPDGFAADVVRLIPNDFGAFRLRFEYVDMYEVTVEMSPAIIVLDD